MGDRAAAGTKWLVLLCAILSVALIPILLSRVLWDTSLFSALAGTMGGQFARLVNMSQVLLALPLGLLDLVLGFSILLRSPSKRAKPVAIAAIVIGVLGILTGLVWLMLLSGVFGQVY